MELQCRVIFLDWWNHWKFKKKQSVNTSARIIFERRSWLYRQQITSEEGVGVVQGSNMMPFQTKHCHFDIYSWGLCEAT